MVGLSYKGVGHASTLPKSLLHKIIIIIMKHRLKQNGKETTVGEIN